jgi:hypothetical protein
MAGVGKPPDTSRVIAIRFRLRRKARSWSDSVQQRALSGFGLLFLVGGWKLEMLRRKLVHERAMKCGC